MLEKPTSSGSLFCTGMCTHAERGPALYKPVSTPPSEWWPQQEVAAHLVYAQPVEELDASDTEAEKVRSSRFDTYCYRVQIAPRSRRLMFVVAS